MDETEAIGSKWNAYSSSWTSYGERQARRRGESTTIECDRSELTDYVYSSNNW